MNCKKIQEWILTDYLDGEMSQDQKDVLEKHISSCSECKRFLFAAKETVVEPFVNSKKDYLSESVVWEKIQEEIQDEKEAAYAYAEESGFLKRVKDILFSPKPAFALGTFAVILLLIVTVNSSRQQVQLVKNNQVQQIVLIQDQSESEEVETFSQEEYLAYFLEENDNYEGYGTSLESYFL